MAKTLESLQNQSLPKDDYEVIVVDNASADETGAVVKSLAASSPILIRYVYEPRLGVSYARNAGLAAAKGDFTAYLDDDEEASYEWLRSIVDSFGTVKPEPGIVCGPVNPSWQSPPPAWLIDDLKIYLSVLSLGPSPHFMQGVGCWFPEGNSAFRTSVLREIGGFPVNIGRKGKSLLSGEFRKVEEHMRSMGRKIYYHPSMSVDHFIPSERLSLKWLTRRTYCQGLSDAISHLEGRVYGPVATLKYSILYTVLIFPPLVATIWNWAMGKLPQSGLNRRIKYVCGRLDFARKLGWLYGFAVHVIRGGWD